MFAVEAARSAASADAAPIGATTIGAGLPAGDITASPSMPACFDGPLFVAEVNGAWLKGMLRRANQGRRRPSPNGVARTRGRRPGGHRGCPSLPLRDDRLAARNAKSYLGANPPALMQHPELTLSRRPRRAAPMNPPAPSVAPPIPARFVSRFWINVTYYVTFCGVVTVAGGAEAPPPVVEADELFRLGRELFEQVASPEVKAQFEFPSKAQWDAFAPRLQRALEGESLAELALAGDVRATLTMFGPFWLRGSADWLEQRLIDGRRPAGAAPVSRPRPPAASV